MSGEKSPDFQETQMMVSVRYLPHPEFMNKLDQAVELFDEIKSITEKLQGMKQRLERLKFHIEEESHYTDNWKLFKENRDGNFEMYHDEHKIVSEYGKHGNKIVIKRLKPAKKVKG